MGEPTFTVRDGFVMWRGLLVPPDEAQRLLASLETASRNRADYFRRPAAPLAADLRGAMIKAGARQ